MDKYLPLQNKGSMFFISKLKSIGRRGRELQRVSTPQSPQEIGNWRLEKSKNQVFHQPISIRIWFSICMGQNEEPLLWVPALPVDLYPRSLLLLIVFLPLGVHHGRCPKDAAYIGYLVHRYQVILSPG